MKFTFYRDIFHYLDEETQDAVFYQEEDESTFENESLLAQKLEAEIQYLFQGKNGTTSLVNLVETTSRVAKNLLELSDNEPYGVRGARIILKFRNLSGEDQLIGSFNVDPNTVSLYICDF